MSTESKNLKRFGRVRSMLFAPAVRPDFLAKLPSRHADAVVIDCEDATPPTDTAKAEARVHAAEWGPRLAAANQQVVVRVNSITTRWFADDITAALSTQLTAVILPKAEDSDQLDAATSAMDTAGYEGVGLVAGIETALGVENARSLLAHPRVSAGYFGAEDFVVDMGGVRTETNAEVAYARSRVALAGRLGGVPTLDQVVTDFGNDVRFDDECRQARALGYSGKLCIHPAQVVLANTLFSPSPPEVERARRLLDAYQAGLDAGVAAVDFEGQMVDEPLAAQARRIIAFAQSDQPNEQD